MQFVQKLGISLSLKEGLEPLRDPEYWPTERNRPSCKACFNALRQIKNKERLDMELYIEDHNAKLSIKHLAHLLETFRPVYEELIAAGAKIKILSVFFNFMSGDREADITSCYTMKREAWLEHFKRSSEEMNQELQEEEVDTGFDLRRVWDVEGDREFDDCMRKGLIQY